jgi:tRNA-dihydrouridine synthase C
LLTSQLNALVLAPMDGITDAPMRALQGESGAFSYAVTEFLRVNATPIPAKVFLREVPELATDAKTVSGMPVQLQILGGDPEQMALSAVNACNVGATAIDINFGCPAPTVNRHDGGSSLLKYPCRIREIVHSVRCAVPSHIPVSAKLRLGWDSIDSIYENADMAAEGGASWLTIHARTRMQGYQPPVYWQPIGRVRAMLDIPVIANGDIWTIDDFRRCQDQTGCRHFMIGRGALANPRLPYQIAGELGIESGTEWNGDWIPLLRKLVAYTGQFTDMATAKSVTRLKQWLKLAANFGDFKHFEHVKLASDVDEFFGCLAELEPALTIAK